MVRAVSLSTTALISRRLTAAYLAAAFGVWLNLVPGEGPASIQCSTSAAVRATLALKLFRGVPAISKLV
jgi:hypothetical protein